MGRSRSPPLEKLVSELGGDFPNECVRTELAALLEPLITATGGSPTAWPWVQRGLRNGYFGLWLLIAGRKLGGILLEAQNREGTGSQLVGS